MIRNLYLLVTIAGQRVAIPASAVESVVEVDEIAPVPMAPAHVAGLTALRSRVLTVIDSYAALGLGRMPDTTVWPMVVVVVQNHLYGLVVDAVDDVAELTGEAQPIACALGSTWGRAASSFMDADGVPLLLLDVVALIAAPVPEAA